MPPEPSTTFVALGPDLFVSLDGRIVRRQAPVSGADHPGRSGSRPRWDVGSHTDRTSHRRPAVASAGGLGQHQDRHGAGRACQGTGRARPEDRRRHRKHRGNGWRGPRAAGVRLGSSAARRRSTTYCEWPPRTSRRRSRLRRSRTCKTWCPTSPKLSLRSTRSSSFVRIRTCVRIWPTSMARCRRRLSP